MRPRILIIDDEPRWIAFATSNLNMFEVVAVPDTETAIDKLESGEFDLIITSARRLDALKAINEKFTNKPAVVTTVYPNSQEARNAYRLGAKRYFAKSFNHDDLFNEVKKVIPASAEAKSDS